ncbi:hypothetical protein [Glutamicibacter ardleyensis]|uniref:hypothetical protein n=1 Tax=Glutamicibacter ardleyensis TaxID=225894 RepID=UPI003FCFBFDA
MSEQTPQDGTKSSADALSNLRASAPEAVTEPKQSDAKTETATIQEPVVTNAPATAPNPVLSGLATVWSSVVLLWQGNTVGALRAATQSKSYPLVALALYAVIGGLLLSTFLTRGLNGLDSFAGDMSYYVTGGSYSTSGSFSATIGQWLGAFILGAILFAIVFVVRSLCLKWTFAVRGGSQSFDTTTRIVATAYAIPMVLLLVATVFFMIPSLALSAVVMFIVAIVSLPVGLIPEILLYVGLNRTQSFAKSPLIPHVSFTLVWAIIVAISYGVIFSIFAEAIS